MAIAAVMAAVGLAIGLAALAGGILLQIFLSRRESRWPGLILPMLTLLSSLPPLLSAAEAGAIFKHAWAAAAMIFAGSLPTVVLLAIYWAVREKRCTRTQIEKMNIDDL